MESKRASNDNRKETCLRVVQLNARRARYVLPELRQKAVAEGVNVLLLQEPYQRQSRIEGFGAGARIVKDDNDSP